MIVPFSSREILGVRSPRNGCRRSAHNGLLLGPRGTGKEHQSEIATPRQNLVARRRDLQTNLDNSGRTLEHVEALMGYCDRVLQQLQTVDPTGKR